MEQDIYSQEFSVNRIVSEGWNKYKGNFKLIFMIIAAVTAGEYAVAFGANYLFSRPFMSWLGDAVGQEYPAKFANVLAGLVGVLSTLAIAYVVKMKIDGQAISFSQAWEKAVSKWMTTLGTGILEGIFAVLLFLLLIVPGIIFSVYWMFATYAVVLQDKSGEGALKYSKAIVQGRWWKVLGYSLVFILIIYGISLIVNIPVLIVETFIKNNNIVFVLDVALKLMDELIYAFYAVMFSIFFINFDATKKILVPKTPVNEAIA